MIPRTCALLSDAALAVEFDDPHLARQMRGQVHHMTEWGYRTHEYDRLVEVAARVLPNHEAMPR
jgi:hypothetical protein